jgi:ATP/maltotriose-dependent transcriptional regulator MalT/DNA-binding SARP family transcriptional activator
VFVHRLKLRPPQLLPLWIERPVIERRLRAGVRVLSIVGGPGYGKTVLAARLHAAWEGPKLWYSLDPSDADIAIFATHVDAMIRGLEGARAFDGDAWRLSSPREVGSQFAESLADVMPSPLVVFDDVHVLDGSRALPALVEFVERAARVGVTFVLCGRTMPVPLHAFAAGGALATVSAADLAFDDREATAYLERTAETPNAAGLTRLVRRAEGWPAGLALIARTASARGGPAPETLSAHDDETRGLLFEYLATEVLEGLHDRERRFFLETSILEELEAELCDDVLELGDSSAVLASFAARGLFIARRGDDAYTAHQLFREFLRHNLERTYPPEAVSGLHRRAARALAERGDHPGAVAHLIAAGDADQAAAALERSALAMYDSGLASRVATFLERIGDARIEASPTLLIALGRVHQSRGDWDRALAAQERAIALARTRREFDAVAEAVRLCAPMLASRGELERLLNLLEETLKLQPKLSETSTTSLLMTLGAVYLDFDRFDDALEVFKRIMPSVVARGDLAIQGMVLHNTAAANMRRGDPYAAVAMYERALKVKRSAGLRVSSLLTMSNLIYAQRVLGDFDEAERLTARMLEDARDVGNANLVAFAFENEGALKLARGDIAAAAAAFREALSACDPSEVVVLPDIYAGLARCAVNSGNYAEADEFCAKAISIHRGTGKRRQAIAAVLFARAECAYHRGEFTTSLNLAREAIALGGDGADSVLEATISLEAAALLVDMTPKLGASAAEADALASRAATNAVALVHQRDYRFLLRTKAAAFERLAGSLRRWHVGAGLLSEPDVAKPAATLRIEMLGGLRVAIGGESLPADAWKRRKARDIFAYLVSLRGRSVARSRLVDLYWPETDADGAHDNLRVTISSIRKAVGDIVKFEENGYRFVAPPHTVVDIELFDQYVESARVAAARGDAVEARRAYVAATDLYRGEFLEGMEDGGWQWRERERVRAACLEALRWLAQDPAGEPAARRLALERLLEVAPFDLDAVRMRLDGLAREMRVAEALRDYDDWRARYKLSVGVEAPEVWALPGASATGTGGNVLRLSHRRR